MISRSDAAGILQDLLDYVKGLPKIKGQAGLIREIERRKRFIGRYKVDGEKILTLMVREAYSMTEDYQEYVGAMPARNDKSIVL
jgi:hypothetical protein